MALFEAAAVQVKEEREELRVSQEGGQQQVKQESDSTVIPITLVWVKREEAEEKPLMCPLHQDLTPSTDAPSSCSAQPSSGDGKQSSSAESALSRSDGHRHFANQTSLLHTFHSESTKEANNLTEAASQSKAQPKPFRCAQCGKCFAKKYHLNKHVTIHSGERPFRCDDCGKSFGRKSHLKRHARVHPGEKLFRCDVCGDIFTYKIHLNLHSKVHIRETLGGSRT